MFTKAFTLTTIALLFSACQLQAAVVNSRWVGDSWGLWTDANNWTPWGVPNNQNFIVTIDSDAIDVGEVGVGLQEDINIDRLDCYGNIMLVAWKLYEITLTFINANGLTNHGEFMFDGNFEMNGNLHNTIGANLQVQDRLRFKKGEVQNDGFILITPGGNLGADVVFNNSGTILMYQAQCNTSSTISVFNNDDKGNIKGSGVIHSGGSIRNRGTVCAAGNGLLLAAEETITNNGLLSNMANSSLTLLTLSMADVNNFGTIEVNAGSGVTFDCNLVNEPNAVIKLLGGTLAATTITQKAGATLKGFGGITGNIVIEPNAVINLTGPTNIVGDLTIGEGTTLDISNGTVLVTGDVTCNSGIIQTTKGTIIIQGEMKGICERKIIDVVGFTGDPNE